MSNDFEVLPVGSLDELITVRKAFAELLILDSRDDYQGIRSKLRELKDYYVNVVAQENVA